MKRIERYNDKEIISPQSGDAAKPQYFFQSLYRYIISIVDLVGGFSQLLNSFVYKQKIHVFCDNAPYYRNKTVQQYLTTSKISLHFLPPYSPNLNPIERLWKWMKERVIYNTYHGHVEDFRGAVLGFFAVLSTVAEESILGQALRRRVRDKFRALGTPEAVA